MRWNVTHFFKNLPMRSYACWRYTCTRTFLNFIFPPRCAICDCFTDDAPSVCPPCFSQLHIISDPVCNICGCSFSYDFGSNNLCIPCQTEAPSYDRARAAIHYDNHSRRLVTRVKYSDRTDLVKLGASLMSQAGHELLAHTDIIIPVPLHWLRLFTRTYNQSQLFAQALSDLHSIPCIPHALQRIRYTTSQTTLGWHERQYNVKNAFRVRRSIAKKLKGKRVLIIDDVFTTGATIFACTKALKKAQVSSVFVLTLARRMPTD
jgi:ComF family protein